MGTDNDGWCMDDVVCTWFIVVSPYRSQPTRGCRSRIVAPATMRWAQGRPPRGGRVRAGWRTDEGEHPHGVAPSVPGAPLRERHLERRPLGPRACDEHGQVDEQGERVPRVEEQRRRRHAE